MSQTQQIAKYHPAFLDSSQMPETVQKKVAARSLLQKHEEKIGRNSVALFIRFQEKTYAAHPGELVPEGSVLERDEAGQICGIPAVTGG